MVTCFKIGMDEKWKNAKENLALLN